MISLINSFSFFPHQPKLRFSPLGTIFSRQHFEIFILFSLENRIWHFKQTVSNGDNLHEKLNSIYGTICIKCQILFFSGEKQDKYFKMLSAENFQKGPDMQKSKQEVTKVISIVNMAENLPSSFDKKQIRYTTWLSEQIGWLILLSIIFIIYRIYQKYWDTLSTNTCPKVWKSPFYYLLMCLKYCCMYGSVLWSHYAASDLGQHCLSVPILRVITVVQRAVSNWAMSKDVFQGMALISHYI